MANNDHLKPKKERALLKATGSILLAIIASSHHWLHTLLIALGLTTLGAGLLSMPPFIKLVFLLFSLAFSIWFIMIAKRKWSRNRPAASVYFISSIISMIIVFTAIPDTIATFNQTDNQDHPIEQPDDHEKHSGHK
jgi:predicted permease